MQLGLKLAHYGSFSGNFLTNMDQKRVKGALGLYDLFFLCIFYFDLSFLYMFIFTEATTTTTKKPFNIADYKPREFFSLIWDLPPYTDSGVSKQWYSAKKYAFFLCQTKTWIALSKVIEKWAKKGFWKNK